MENFSRSKSVVYLKFSRKGSRSATRVAEKNPKDLNPQELSTFKEIRAVLGIPSFKRTKEQINIIASYLNTIPYFQDLQEKESEEVIYEAAKYLKHHYSVLKTFPLIVEDEANRFFLILSGNVRLYKKGAKGPSQCIEVHKHQCFGEPFNPEIVDYYQASCLGPTHFGVLDSIDYKRMRDHLFDKKFKIILRFLSTIPFLSGLSRKYIQKIISFFKVRRFKRNEVVFKENEKPNYVYFIEEGEFTVIKNSRISTPSPSRLYREPIMKDIVARQKLAILGKGETMGEEDVVMKKNFRSYGCECCSNAAKVLMISAYDFLNYLAKTEDVVDILKKRCEEKMNNRNTISRINSETLKMRLPSPKPPISPLVSPRSNLRDVLTRSGHTSPMRTGTPKYRIYYKPLDK